MDIDAIMHSHQLHCIQTFPFQVGDCLFNSIAYLLNNSQTAKELRFKSMAYLTDLVQTIVSPASRETLDIHFSPTILNERHGITSISVYIKLMDKLQHMEGFRATIVQCFAWQIICIEQSMFGQQPIKLYVSPLARII